MKKTIMLITFFSLVILPMGKAFCENATSQNSFEDTELRDPFISQLPQKEIPVKILTAPITAPKVSAPVAPITPPPLQITGVIWNTLRPQAIVNGKIVDVGDRLGDLTILSIDRDFLEISYQGKNFEIGTQSQNNQPLENHDIRNIQSPEATQ